MSRKVFGLCITICMLMPTSFAWGGGDVRPAISDQQPVQDNVIEYALTTPLVRQLYGTLSRLDAETWEIDVDEIAHPLVFSSMVGNTDISVRESYMGVIELGIHGQDLAVTVETGEGLLRQAVLIICEEDVLFLAAADSPLRLSGSLAADDPELLRIVDRLVEVHANADARRAFATDGICEVDSSEARSNSCAGGRCSCFLSCSACCGAGQVASCDCQFLGHNNCSCTQVFVPGQTTISQ